jgi:hypothetical protein
VSVDPKSRNEMRGLVVRSVAEWANVRAELGPSRLLVVFVDDLDRCSPVNVLQVFEAIKLYLDAPGLVFIVGYDRDVVSDAILDVKQYSDAVTSHRYLEKIVQLVYRLPGVGDDEAEGLLRGYLDASGTAALFDRSARSLTIEQNGRNPRRIKRFLNAFILEYGLDAEWQKMGPETLVRALIIDVYFPDFGRLLRLRSSRDPVGDFREYVAIRDIVRRRSGAQSDLDRVTHAFVSRGLGPPTRDEMITALPDLEAELPATFPKLAQNPDFLELLDGIVDIEGLREKLRRFSPTAMRRPVAGGRIVVSSPRETRAAAARLIADLASRFGQDRMSTYLGPADTWLDQLRTALETADVVVLVIGPGWWQTWADEPDPTVRTGLVSALRASGALVIPVLVDGADLRPAQDVPNDVAPLLRRNAIVIHDDRWTSGVERLVDAIEYWSSAGAPREL